MSCAIKVKFTVCTLLKTWKYEMCLRFLLYSVLRFNFHICALQEVFPPELNTHFLLPPNPDKCLWQWHFMISYVQKSHNLFTVHILTIKPLQQNGVQKNNAWKQQSVQNNFLSCNDTTLMLPCDYKN